MRISDWSSDVCSSDLRSPCHDLQRLGAGPVDGCAPGRLRRADADQSRNEYADAQYRFPCRQRRTGRRRAGGGDSRRENDLALHERKQVVERKGMTVLGETWGRETRKKKKENTQ